MSYADRVTEDFQRAEILRLLDQCTPHQRECFNRLFPGTIPAKDLKSVIDLCHRTVVGNDIKQEQAQEPAVATSNVVAFERRKL